MIRHGYSRNEELPFECYSLNTFDVVNPSGQARDASRGSLRLRFKIPATAKILLVSVNKDHFLEHLWRDREPRKLAALAALGIACMTAPNYSFFDDAPRLHTLRNLWRIVRFCEEIADAGIHPVLHLNALTPEDWSKWEQILLGAPGARVVCKEFQTGLRDPDRAMNALDEMARLQDKTKRDLHPLIVGGRRLTFDVARRFAHFTIIDSVPFIATMKRKRITIMGTSATQISSPTERGEPLDALLDDNIRAYTRLVELSAVRAGIDTSALADFDQEDDVIAPEVPRSHEPRTEGWARCSARTSLTVPDDR